MTRRRRPAPVLVVLLAAALAGCAEQPEPSTGRGPTPSSPAASPSSTGSPPVSGATSGPTSGDDGEGTGPASRGRLVKTAPSEFGVMLFDGTGQAIYLFDKETTSRPACYGPCAQAWPPVLTTGRPRARGQVDPGLLGTTMRRDGSRQVTYAGHPLYYYAHEGKNQVLCHDVSQYGGLWLVVTPGGEPAP